MGFLTVGQLPHKPVAIKKNTIFAKKFLTSKHGHRQRGKSNSTLIQKKAFNNKSSIYTEGGGSWMSLNCWNIGFENDKLNSICIQ